MSDIEITPELTEAELDAASVKAIRRMASYCADPSSPWHQVAIAYVTPRAVALANALARLATSTQE
jgi:hypothetical protein